MRQDKPARTGPPPVLWVGMVTMILLGAFYLFGGNASRGEKGPVPSPAPGEITVVAPAFTLNDLNGNSVSLSDFKGKVVILNFWATWCPPCKKEIPDFIDLQTQYGSKGVQIVGIALDQPDKVRAFAQQNGLNYSVLLGDQEIAVKYGGITGIPTTIVIDRKGKIVSQFEGFRPRSVFETEIKKLL